MSDSGGRHAMPDPSDDVTRRMPAQPSVPEPAVPPGPRPSGTGLAPSASGVGTATAVAPAKRGKVPKAALSEGKRAERKLGLLLIAPAAIVMLLVTAYPIVYAFWLSLHKSSLAYPGRDELVWFSNYSTVLTDGYWWTAFGVTMFITVVSVVIEFVLGLAIALVMHRSLVGRGLVRTVVLIPYGIVTVVAAFSWFYAWTPGTGYLANLLPDGNAPLTQQWPSLFIVILAEVWKTTPFMALLLLSGLALVPDDLLKAAAMDGAGAWTRLVKIILPLMKPAILVALLFRTLDAFRIFDNIYILTNGSNKTGSVSILGYDNLFKAFNLGMGSAISVLIFVCVAIIAFIFVKAFGTAVPGADSEERR
ncbi:ABC transporter permease subunit [Tsukamurella sp. 8F]|uniref:ABC transporter permease subunit n=1 Tax=unclassified Tsukamurella TaxID=2633480 RepID=UPI0023B8D72D|nr:MULTISPECIES: ABC transporter permease subunit [unclassified Tsukamurella]MDF0530354.1 ABC transporter permease subunit [Tsukamurella sp. 8J]MDF0587651.1 ABC transporter permease subunit [Tsukamurella sp. 8F]